MIGEGGEEPSEGGGGIELFLVEDEEKWGVLDDLMGQLGADLEYFLNELSGVFCIKDVVLRGEDVAYQFQERTDVSE